MSENRTGTQYNLALPLMYTEPNRQLATTYMSIDAADKLDLLRQAAAVLNVTFSLSYAYRDPARDRYSGVLVLDLTNARESPQQISDALNRVDGVHVEPLNGPGTGLAAFERNSLDVAGTQMTVIAQAYLGGTYRRMLESLGDQAADLLFQSGEDAGNQAAGAVPGVAAELGLEITPEMIKQRFYDLQVFGWATVADLQVDEQFQGETLLTNTFESGVWDGNATMPVCHWIRGFISGVLSTALGTSFQVDESECQAKGDAHCRLTFRR